ncbi:class II fructose-bisphosphate aldolase [Thiohalomonas denitrificans]|uniref:Fructose-bisphosphate aldolase, class II n=1 Tax=Thiohalomonas denitrificans TaxID=415747 RepID=A0A1G5Q0R1_9GAMM|nr:class II fructose-bisphosphate aldolase [Thiohalomonas denitrificans]SCZ55267.1 fructose-bisphosphate aldolase, class II [Thiohalomonas denitrificans]
MALVEMKAMLRHAYENGYAIGGVDVIDLGFLAGVIDAAERCRAPVILSLAESHFRHYDIEVLMPAVESAAQRASVPVAIHLDHGASLESAVKAIRLGCNGVMVDASEEPLAINRTRTREVVQMAHACGVPVEGEIGYVPGEEGESAELHPGAIAYTDADTAEDYVKATGVDFLAVSIGTVHGRFRRKPELDFDRLEQINTTLRMPLVIHGGTGLDDEQFGHLVRRGVAKINYYTALADAAEQAARKVMDNGQYAHLFDCVSRAVSEETERCMHLWGSAGRAAEVLSRCPAWEPVEHLITYNAEQADPATVYATMEEGRKVLSAIPGVRSVETGEAIDVGKARFQYCWLVRFTHPAVISSYRDHPSHTAFADRHFRPLAPERMSIDYRLLRGLQPPDPH